MNNAQHRYVRVPKNHMVIDFDIPNDGTLPEYIKRFSAPISADAEVSFECDIDTSLFAKLTGIDLAQGRDATCASVIFQKPYQVQRRHHKKKRINKKWAKRYGYITKFKTYQLEDVHIEQNEVVDILSWIT